MPVGQMPATYSHIDSLVLKEQHEKVIRSSS
ncbi:hypothetical protein RKD38_002116 [Streptomyces ambofaciens]